MSSPDQPNDPWVKQPPSGPGSQPGWGQPQPGQGYPGQGYPPPGYGPPPGYPPYNPQQAYAAMVNFPKPTGWFVVNWIFLWPLAIYSLVSAWSNIDRALFVGDIAGAQYQAARVRKFGIIALGVAVGLWVLSFLMFFFVFAAATSSSGQLTP